MKELQVGSDWEMQDIKTQPMTAEQVDEMAQLAGSYEAIFSRKAMKYKALGLANQSLSEADYRKWILEEYTFLKRPVVLLGNEVFVGNTRKVTDQTLAKLGMA